ncbi:hypothetical protein [Pseudoalteromonas luteoviolacea]|uniref:Uncharacterized protein n=1 Tax=Pseudoalteromonas luteoviolacea S4060-1 TaxID=1365257 RepID=A0A167LQJ6_9GAMM|nr:hypothetical protein [Pseudoalteromonas luteoviolacea]KZN65016.1 hypothetical protein N478_03140 [Pseudoalteromonas luteoviolacea S4060-1]
MSAPYIEQLKTNFFLNIIKLFSFFAVVYFQILIFLKVDLLGFEIIILVFSLFTSLYYFRMKFSHKFLIEKGFLNVDAKVNMFGVKWISIESSENIVIKEKTTKNFVNFSSDTITLQLSFKKEQLPKAILKYKK